MTSVRLDHITKRFDETLALDDISLDVSAGELFFLLGPSGCGKSTLLRLIAGLHEPTAGRIFFNDRDVTDLGTEKRNAVMCFQSYALWPHMTVRENVRFGLNVRKLPRQKQDQRIDEVLRLVRMTDYAQRKPNQLSGGQQQRVALARAIAVEPAVLLLDEPLSNLDAKLRNEMRTEIRRICKESGLTTIYVTHDQKEALSVADRIAVMENGIVAQIGTPSDLYNTPATAFVADFIGHTNLIRGTLAGRRDGLATVRTDFGDLLVQANALAGGDDGPVTVSLRPEQVKLGESGRNRLAGEVRESTFLGEASEHVVEVAGRPLKVIAMPPRFGLEGQVTISFDPADAVILRGHATR